jgi:RNA polymerase sigma factor (sigma-70 family)
MCAPCRCGGRRGVQRRVKGTCALSKRALGQMQAQRLRVPAWARKESMQLSADEISASHTGKVAPFPVHTDFLRSTGALEKEESAVAWFYRMLRNAVIDHYRKHGSNQRALGAWAKELEGDAVLPEALKREVCRCVGSLLTGLKPEYRDALEQVDLAEGSLRDLAHRAEISENNAAVRVHRARRALLNRVRIICNACAKHGCLDCDCKQPFHPTPRKSSKR